MTIYPFKDLYETQINSSEGTTMTEEDEEFERIEKKKHTKEIEVIYKEFDDQYEIFKRNEVLEEVAQEFDKMKFGDTSQSFAIFVRNMKK
jgi:hypothetical protein